jgi:hypothetical protein
MCWGHNNTVGTKKAADLVAEKKQVSGVHDFLQLCVQLQAYAPLQVHTNDFHTKVTMQRPETELTLLACSLKAHRRTGKP